MRKPFSPRLWIMLGLLASVFAVATPCRAAATIDIAAARALPLAPPRRRPRGWCRRRGPPQS